MGLLDDVLGSAVPGGNLAKPLMIGLAALLGARAVGGGLGNLLGGTGPAGQIPPVAPPAQPGTSSQPQGGLFGGLSGLLQSFQQGGHGDVINSWIGTGQNQPISPGQLGSALGPEVIKVLAQKTGLPEQELGQQLSQLLPIVVDKLTPNGRMPTLAEIQRPN